MTEIQLPYSDPDPESKPGEDEEPRGPYKNLFVPLIVVPLISLLTTEDENRKTRFYDILAGRAEAESQV